MNKKEFLEELFDELLDRDVKMASITEIVDDHDAMITEAVENGVIEEEFIAKLGRPSTIARTISRMEVKETGIRQKLIATSPFVATIVYFILGMQYNLWHPGWLVFLIVPIAGVVFGSRFKFETLLMGLSPFLTTIFFILYGTYAGVWHPTWLVFFIIPVLGFMFEKDPKKKYIGGTIFTIVPLAYLYLELMFDYQYTWMIFGILIIAGIWLGVIQVSIGVGGDKKIERETIILSIIIGVIYVVLGVMFAWWHPAWILFLLIPVYAMVRIEDKLPFVAYTPFIATALFIIVGEAFNAYTWSWILFLMIPLAGIFTDSDSDEFEKIMESKPGLSITIGGDDIEDVIEEIKDELED